jgi:hypothetical protein
LHDNAYATPGVDHKKADLELAHAALKAGGLKGYAVAASMHLKRLFMTSPESSIGPKLELVNRLFMGSGSETTGYGRYADYPHFIEMYLDQNQQPHYRNSPGAISYSRNSDGSVRFFFPKIKGSKLPNFEDVPEHLLYQHTIVEEAGQPTSYSFPIHPSDLLKSRQGFLRTKFWHPGYGLNVDHAEPEGNHPVDVPRKISSTSTHTSKVPLWAAVLGGIGTGLATIARRPGRGRARVAESWRALDAAERGQYYPIPSTVSSGGLRQRNVTH